MISKVYVEGRRIALNPSRSLGKGGEAEVYDLGDGRVVKVFKSPDDPDYQGHPDQERAARDRIETHQQKLKAFPPGLPPEVIAPIALATDRSGKRILGYAMALVADAEPLLRYSDPVYRRTGVPSADVVVLFRELHRVVRALHARHIVIGDFNDLNVLVTRGCRPRIIDADSFQFGGFSCQVFTERFVDPLLCDTKSEAPKLSRSYNTSADWYAYNVLLFQSLLFVGPYGGVFRPADPAKRLPHSQRPLSRITIFHPEVRYPKPARPYRALPDDLLHHFYGVFERDERAPFPVEFLDRLAFLVCPKCGAEHARIFCPFCSRNMMATREAPSEAQSAVARAATLATTVRGEVQCERLFKTTGVIVHASLHRGDLELVSFADGVFRREDGTPVLHGALDPRLRFRVLGRQTFVGRGGELLAFEGDAQAPERLSVDAVCGSSVFDANGQHCFRVSDGHLLRDVPSPLNTSRAEVVGEILEHQTRIWVGPALGLGFYRAGNLSRVFLFDAKRRGINDEISLPHLAGELVDAEAALDEHRAWLFLAFKHAGRIRHLCFVYARTGHFEASSEAEPGGGDWLGTLRGKCATGGLLFAATDAGIVRVEVRDGTISKTGSFPDTEAFVDDTCQLLVGRRGLCVVRQSEVLALRIAKGSDIDNTMARSQP